ncbi:MAG: hypothetical protein H6P98_2798, partial [Candidatus Aminicenantes bacterium]|nr:hypothetical protein [Candidatus Aminicenantes bacterium]
MLIPIVIPVILTLFNAFPAAQEPPAKGFDIRPEIWQKYLGEYLYEGKQYVSVFRFSQQAEDGSLF